MFPLFQEWMKYSQPKPSLRIWPDIILFDYFDIILPVMNELEDETSQMEKGKGLAGERHC